MDREFDIEGKFESKAVAALAIAMFLVVNGAILAGMVRIAAGV